MDFFEKTIEKREGLGYVVRFPWKNNKDELPDHYILALKRLQSVVKSSKPEVLEQMEKIFKEQKARNIIVEVDKNAIAGSPLHFNPHHPVLTPHKSTTKCRVVVDGDARFKNGLSLNDVIHAGPILLKDLFQILIRFRSGKNAMLSDIEKAFLYVYLHEDDQDSTRFLWLKDIKKPATEDNIIIYRFTRVLFGINASPFLLNATVKRHLEQEEDKELAQAILNQIYVDNILLVTDNNIDDLYKKMKDIFQRAGMNLREFRSNKAEFNKKVPIQDLMEEEVTKVLGVLWDTKNDVMKVSCKMKKEDKLSRRICSSIIHSNYDPYGIMAPLFLKMKNFYSTLWRENQEWDTPLLQREVEEWNTMVESIEGFSKEIKRELISLSKTNTLITFTDASKHASACVVYNKMEGRTNIVAAKSKVTNKYQNWTIPKLELKALAEGSQLTEEVLKAATIGGAKFDSVVLMTDSEICKKWVERPPGKKDTGIFVTNRLKEIKSIWQSWKEQGLQVFIGYVNTESNPADAATRGLSSIELEDHIWWNGPEFINEDLHKWPDATHLFDVNQEDNLSVHSTIVLEEPAESENPLNIQTNSLMKMKRIYGRVLKAVKKMSNGLSEIRRMEMEKRIPELKNVTSEEKLIAAELMNAEQLIIKHHQKTMTQKTLKQVRELNPFMDDIGIVRCKGRLDNIEGTEDTKFPVLVSSKSILSRMIIDEIHGKYHKAVGQTIATVREKFWIPSLRQEVKRRLQSCVKCQRFNNKPFKYPDMMSIPKKRVVRAKPFENCGLDYFGPMKYQKRGESTRENCYGAIITCSTTRLIYLDIVKDLTTESFILMMRRFFANHGVPSSIVSDNAPQFLLAKEILHDAMKVNAVHENVSNFCMKQGIDWKNITAYSPWKGGFYERMIKSVKLSLNKAYGRRVLTFEELRTSIQEIAGTLNCRPLTYSEEKDTILPIRPIDFISPKITISVELLDQLKNSDDYLPNSEQQKLQTRKDTIEALQSSLKFTENVWKIWHEEYIRELRAKQKARMDSKRGEVKKPNEGSVVLVVDENIPRNFWRLGRITSVRKDKDNQIREVKLVTDTKREITRPINLLVPLEIDDVEEELPTKPEKGATEVQPVFEDGDAEKRYNFRARKKVNYDEDIYNTNSAINMKERRIIHSATFGLCPSSWLHLIMLMCVTSTMAIESNKIECVNSGIKIHNYTKGDMKICAEQYCTHQNTDSRWMTNLPLFLDIWIPASIKSRQHHVSIKATKDSSIITTEKSCPPVSFCESIACTWCTENIFNPKCFPTMSIIMMVTFLLSSIGICYVICCIPIRIAAPCIYIYRLIRWCCRRRRITRLRRRRSEVREALLALTIIISLCFIVPVIYGCQEIEMESESNKVCVLSENGEEHCTSEAKESIKLSSHSREGCLRIKQNGTLKGEWRFKLLSALLKCQRETITFSREVELKVKSVKRCAHMGSCSDIKCENVTRNSHIDELEDINDFPGISGCVESCGGWGCDCFFSASACLFYRIYAMPISNKTIEIFRCDVWKEIVQFGIEMTNFETNTHAEILDKLTTNQPRTIGNTTIKLTGVHVPPSPLLDSWFVQADKKFAIWENGVLPQLQCNSSDSAERMECKLEEECNCGSAEKQMICACKKESIRQHLDSHNHKFPLITSYWKFNGNDTVFAEIEEEISATFLLSLHNGEEITIMEEEDRCKAENSHMEGCYKCQEGAVADIKCHSNKKEILGEIDCEGDHHTVNCSPDGKTTRIYLFERTAKVQKNCAIKCGSVRSNFTLNGVLEFHESYLAAVSRLLKGDKTALKTLEFPDLFYMMGVFQEFIEKFILYGLAAVAIIGIIVLLIYFPIFMWPIKTIFRLIMLPFRILSKRCRKLNVSRRDSGTLMDDWDRMAARRSSHGGRARYNHEDYQK